MDREKIVLLSSLDTQREHVAGILEGLPDDALHKPVLPSGWTCMGMVRHLTTSVELFWFRGVFAGEPVDLALGDEEFNAVWHPGREVTGADVIAAYRQQIDLANAIIAAHSLDAPPTAWPDDIWPDWRMDDLREILVHVITETACHAGHLDAARELLDGRQWMV
jgi:uncharacterized protein DUF664